MTGRVGKDIDYYINNPNQRGLQGVYSILSYTVSIEGCTFQAVHRNYHYDAAQ